MCIKQNKLVNYCPVQHGSRFSVIIVVVEIFQNRPDLRVSLMCAVVMDPACKTGFQDRAVGLGWGSIRGVRAHFSGKMKEEKGAGFLN